ncbi:LytR/AlgR family response regulator transcription factor [Collimonas sp. NPDC087041]|uniref:LytR/AlgR family response regulator transcription factor n=1 Tax=Collimonas sp. NPDC087041 TaxID=3363960 RepID=UPI0037FB1DE6
MPTAIIADDEDLPRTELRRMLADVWPELQILAECEYGTEALEAIQQHQPDIAFLDIRMPGLSGLDVAEAIKGNCHAVFVTAYDNHALEAFTAAAMDYLLKPLSRQRLQETVSRLQGRLATDQPTMDVAKLMRELDSRLRSAAAVERIRWISASVGDTIKMFPVEKILFFVSDEKYTRVVSSDDEAHVRKPLRELMAGLDPDQFWQIHRSVVVRADAIVKAYRDDAGKVTVELRGSKERLRVSLAYAWRFRPM